MDTILFNQNWNGKLFLDFFSAVRLHNVEKYSLGNRLEVIFKNNNMGIVQVEAVRPFHFGTISPVLSYLEIGKAPHYLAEILKRFYHNVQINDVTLFDHVILHYTKRNLEAHAVLLEEWWRDLQEAQTPPTT